MKRFHTLTAAIVFAGVAGLSAQAAPPDTVDTLAVAPAVDAEADAEADADDILLVIDLPLVAQELREDGVDDSEIDEALATAEEAGAPAGDAAELLDGEADAVKSRGVKKGFAIWAKRHLAKGHHGVVLRQMAKERGEEPELTEAEAKELAEAMQKTKEVHKARKLALKAQRDALKASGKAMKLRGEARHEHWRKHAAHKHIEHLKQLKADGNTDPRIDKALRRAKHDLAEARGDAKDAREDAKDAREDAKDARGDANEAREDAKEAREDAKEAREDAKEGDREGKEAMKEAMKGHKEATKGHKEAMKGHKEAMKHLQGNPGGKGKGKDKDKDGKKGGGR